MICDALGLDKEQWTVGSEGSKFALRHTSVIIDNSTNIVKARFGLPKGAAKALVKLQVPRRKRQRRARRAPG